MSYLIYYLVHPLFNAPVCFVLLLINLQVLCDGSIVLSEHPLRWLNRLHGFNVVQQNRFIRQPLHSDLTCQIFQLFTFLLHDFVGLLSHTVTLAPPLFHHVFKHAFTALNDTTTRCIVRVDRAVHILLMIVMLHHHGILGLVHEQLLVYHHNFLKFYQSLVI